MLDYSPIYLLHGEGEDLFHVITNVILQHEHFQKLHYQRTACTAHHICTRVNIPHPNKAAYSSNTDIFFLKQFGFRIAYKKIEAFNNILKIEPKRQHLIF
jgi:hypothetical protein